ncbi:CarD family transcriptional regulator [Clostridium sardiniense]|uniref:CarD family transcriptional regulator n=1 Tax=Clostridium sardiniense TaxID=29369 RepID=A0ABS7L1F4_CLOSR|nr:CarD family transcriptional regulator [Clostridium sardiniense]MBY0756896.1 CarD family transcriptional regulator [Clostridium sardiniense]MDQ0458741.1 RNA polymerase-interacting CarD/CdnL/TRCF family regulator [Clostridium sardiniense]
MFNIGDKIVYPSQGVGIIDFIETKEFKGEMKKYYRIHLFNNTMKLMLPFSRVEQSNIRLVSDIKTMDYNLDNMDKFITKGDDLMNHNFKERLVINSTKIKSGLLSDYFEVICNLSQIDSKHPLNTSEKQMLTSTKKILIEEICQSKSLSNEEASNLLELSIVF